MESGNGKAGKIYTTQFYKTFFCVGLAALLCLSKAYSGSTLRVGVFADSRAKAVDEIMKTLEAEDDITAEIIKAGRNVDYAKFQEFDVIFFGGGHSSFNWLNLDARMNLIELVEQRGGGAVFSMFRCGTVARSMIRPLFPEVADAYNKVNSRGMRVVAREHPLTEGLPENFLLPYWDHAVMRLGPDGRAAMLNSGGEIAMAYGESGKGRVVFMGPWIGINIEGRETYPLPGHDKTMLLNSLRWAAGTGAKPEFTEISEITRLKVLRRERVFDWTHDERGKSWNPGLITQGRNRREQDLDSLFFTLQRYSAIAAESPETARALAELQAEIVKLNNELRANYRQSVDLKEREIEKMCIDELSVHPAPSNEKRAQLIEEWRNRLLFPYQIEPVAAKVEALARELEPELRRFNAKKFAEARALDERNVRNLIEQLASGNSEARADAALELARIGDTARRTVNALVDALADNDYTVRRNAIYALSWMRERRAVQPLVNILETHDDARTRRRAAQALGQIGDSGAVENLIEALEDSDYHVRQNSILALGHIGDKRAVEPLMDIVSSCITEKHVEVLAGGHPYDGRLYVSENGWDTADFTCAIRALGHIGDNKPVELLAKIIEKFESEPRHRYLPPLFVTEAAEQAIESIAAGGRGENGIEQLEESRDQSNFYWMTGKYNALFGRYTSWRSEPADSDLMLSYGAAAGGTGIVEFNTPENLEARQPGMSVERHLEQAAELGLKINLEMRHRGKRFDKAGMERDLMRVGGYISFGGFWGEESLHFDETRRALGDITVKEFREFLADRYEPEEFAELGVGEISEVELPVPDNTGRRPRYLRSGARANQKVLFAEYLEFVADQGVEQWVEAQEWLAGMRKGTKMSFTLSDRYMHGGSTFISGYPRVNLALNAAGPQSYGEHASLNNFNLDLHVDGEQRPAQGAFYAHQADTPGRVERGFASSFVYGQQFFNWWWGHIFKHAPDINLGSLVYDPGRWEAAVRQFTKGSALSSYLAPRETRGAGLVTQLYSGRTTTLTYGDGTTDAFGGRGGETVSPSGYPYRYTRNQCALRESVLRSHLPVEMTWIETQYPEKLAGYKVALLGDASSIDDREVEMLREWVRNGGTLIATASSTLHDKWNRKQENYSLADVFGADYIRTEGNPGPEHVERDMKPETGITEIRVTAAEYLGLMEGAISAEYEKAIGYDVVKPTSGRVVAVWEDDTPAIIENRFGEGYAIFISAMYPALSHQTRDITVLDLYKSYWPGMRELIAACVRRGLELAGAELPVEAENCPETVDVVLKRQEQHNRWMAHLLNMDEKNGVIQNVKLTVRPPHPVKSVYYAYPEREELEYTAVDDVIEFFIRPFDVHEMVVIEWTGE